MDFFKTQLDRIQQQLSGLSSSQKMLTASLVAIMVMTLLWWGRYAGQAEMEPVLNQTLSEDDLTRIGSSLSSKGIDYKVVDGKVLVPAERKFQVLAELGFSQTLPRNTTAGFDEIIEKIKPWAPATERDAMYNHAREMTLADVIGRFPNVAQAKVMINPTRERHFGGNVEPSASIMIETRDSMPAGKKLVEAAADMVVGAVAGLSKTHVKVAVNGSAQRVSSPEGGGIEGGDELMDLVARNERRFEEKIANQFNYISGFLVSVTVKINTQTLESESTEYDKEKTFNKELKTSSHTSETSTPSQSGEPGINSNSGMEVTAIPASGTVNTESQETSEYEILPSKTHKAIKDIPGAASAIAAAVRVPRAYFITVLKNADGKDPDKAAVDQLIATELPKIREAVKSCTALKSDSDVSVDTYSDVMPMLVATAAIPSSGTALTSSLAGRTKEIALGALAVISLFMVSMMVRKGTPAPIVAAPVVAMATPVLEGGEAVAGEVGSGSTLLGGMELDDDAVRTQQMLDQVSTMVGDNPDGAANVVKRWLNRS